MINEFWSLVVETWEQGIRGVGVDDIIICLVIVIASLLARSLMNSYVLDKVAKFTERSETTLDDEIIESVFQCNLGAAQQRQVDGLFVVVGRAGAIADQEGVVIQPRRSDQVAIVIRLQSLAASAQQ